jgi:ABC-type nitrate/sulfonate/bicarbonate transport system permease component
MYVAIVAVSLTGYLLDRSVLLARRRVLAWSDEEGA